MWGIHKKYKSLNWFENFMGGHVSIGNLTIYGENAMHWAINYRTKKYGTICLTLPLKCFGKYWGCHIYFSPNGTPWACTYYKSLWKEDNWKEEVRAKLRKQNFGHNFNTDKYSEELTCLNNKFESLMINSYEMYKYKQSIFQD